MVDVLKNILNIIRDLVNENKPLFRSIDSNYEVELVDTLKLVPKQYETEVLNTIEVISTILSNIDYTNIIRILQLKFTDMDVFSVNVNIKKTIEELLTNNVNMKKVEKAKLMNLVTKLDPIINCLNYLVSKPLVTAKKIADMRRVISGSGSGDPLSVDNLW
jgi:hypothetical protein